MNNNEEVKKLIHDHINKYPELQPQDIVKALYQSEFGCSHFIADEEKGMQFLLKEIELNAGFSDDEDFEEDLIEEIGEKFCRVNIRKIKGHGLSPKTLFKLFKLTSELETVSKEAFLSKLDCFEDMCLSGEISFDFDEVRDFISSYKEAGCPAVHHSETFRRLYKPAYRVVSRSLCDVFPVFYKIEALISEKESVILSVEGGAASGKTTLAYILERIYDCNVFHMDSFFLQPHQRTKERFAKPGGNVDYERFYLEILSQIGKPESISYRPYDCRTQSLRSPVEVEQKKLNVVEGVYSMHPTLKNSYDFSVFVRIDEETQRERILMRNGPQMQKRFMSEWIPLENRYFKTLNIEAECDIILDGGMNFEGNCDRWAGRKNGTGHCGTNKEF